MIHCIEKNIFGNTHQQEPVHQILLCYVSLRDIIKKSLSMYSLKFNETIHKYTTIERDEYLTQNDIEKYIKDNNVSTLILTLEIFDMYECDSISIITSLCKKYTNIKFLVSSYETQPFIDIHDSMQPNVFI